LVQRTFNEHNCVISGHAVCVSARGARKVAHGEAVLYQLHELQRKFLNPLSV
jgi:hypothetical protein